MLNVYKPLTYYNVWYSISLKLIVLQKACLPLQNMESNLPISWCDNKPCFMCKK